MKFTEQERDFLKQEFADLCHAAINSMITAGSFVRSIDRIEAIVSERITPEQDTIKPYHEHGNSVASDRTESGQSADGGIAIMEILQPIHRHPFDAESGREMEIWYTHKDVWNAMTTYASQVCADKDAKIKFWVDGWNHLSRMYDQSQSELDRLNEYLTVMVRKNAELQDQIERFKNPLKAK